MNKTNAFISGFLIIAFFVLSGLKMSGHKSASEAMSWNIDKVHSNLSFEIRHFFTPVTGRFQDYSSEIHFDPDNLEGSSIAMAVLVKSIDTDNARRDEDLLSDHFFNAAKYPVIAFKSSNITAEGDNHFIAHGRLTMKDVSKKVDLPFTLLGMQDHPMKENTKIAGVKGGININRTEYHVGVGNWASNAVVGDEVNISFAFEMQHTDSK